MRAPSRNSLGCALISLGITLCACDTHAPASAEERRGLTLALGGDVMFGRWARGAYRAFAAPFAPELAAALESADLAFANLETGACSEGLARSGASATAAQRFRLTASPERLNELARAGIDVVSVANNHALDCGPRGLSATLPALAALGIDAVGALDAYDGARVRVVRGERVVWTAATAHAPPVAAVGLKPRVLASGDAAFLRHVAELTAREPHALRVVSLHWGNEGAAHSAPHQRLYAARLIAAGAHLVVGHGAHVLQEVERHDSGLIVYGTGNLHFDMHLPSSIVRVRAERKVDGGWRVQPLHPG